MLGNRNPETGIRRTDFDEVLENISTFVDAHKSNEDLWTSGELCKLSGSGKC